MTWTYSTMAAFGARIMPEGFVFDVNGSSLFLPEKYYNYVLCFLQSCVGRFIIDSTKSAFSIQAGTIRNLGIISLMIFIKIIARFIRNARFTGCLTVVKRTALRR